MTEQDIEEARDLVDSLEESARDDLYFEITAESAALLARYIRELELRVVKDVRRAP